MNGHSPAPWTFRPNPCECPDCTASHWIDGHPDAPGATLGKPIAEVREYHKGESEANARLIAAAPELADALERLLAYAQTRANSKGDLFVHVRDVLQRARGAS